MWTIEDRAFDFNLEPPESDLGSLALLSHPNVQLPCSSRTLVTDISVYLRYRFLACNSGKISTCAQSSFLASTGDAWGSARFLCLSVCSAEHSCSWRTRGKSCGRRRQPPVTVIVRARARIARA